MTMFSALMRRFRDRSGSTSIEFVLVMPLLLGSLGLAFGVFHVFMEYSRSSKALYTTADITSRMQFIDQDGVDQLHDLYTAFATAPAGSVLRISRLDFVAKDPDDPTPIEGFETDEGYYQVAWSLPTPHDLTCSACSLHDLQFEMISDDLASYDLPPMGDGAHVIVVEATTPYAGPLSDGAFNGLIPNITRLRWNMSHFVWPRHVNGLSLAVEEDANAGKGEVG